MWRAGVLMMIACSHHPGGVADAGATDAQYPTCTEIDAGATDDDIVRGAIYGCGCCDEGQTVCVVMTLSVEGRVFVVSKALNSPPTTTQLECISTALGDRCLPALTTTPICAVGA